MNQTPPRSNRYLSGMDWLVHGFNYLAKRATGVGNLSQIVWEVDGTMDAGAFERAITPFVTSFPLLGGRAARAWNLAPYWRVKKRHTKRLFHVSEEPCPHADDVNELIPTFTQSGCTNRIDDTCYLDFRIFNATDRAFLVMTFDHRIFDARGAEMFMARFQHTWKTRARMPRHVFSAPAHLNRWVEKFKSGQVVNRKFLKMAKNGPIRVIPIPPERPLPGFRFRVGFFDRGQTRKLVKEAYDRAGYLLLMPFLLAAGLWSLEPVFARRGQGHGDYVVPVSVDLRQLPVSLQDVFFNHLSFLMFHVEQREKMELDSLIEELKDQFYSQVQCRFSQHLREVSHLMRIAPLPVLSKVMRTYLGGQLASFCFSHVAASDVEVPEILDFPVIRRFHLPRLPLPPGLGLFFHQAQDQMSVCLSWVDGMLDEDDVMTIFNRLDSVLNLDSKK